jgi:hypothetical protein
VYQEVSDAQRLRRALLRRFDEASFPGMEDEERRRLLAFVVIGSGKRPCSWHLKVRSRACSCRLHMVYDSSSRICLGGTAVQWASGGALICSTQRCVRL